MKKVKVLLSALAIVAAIGATFATQYKSDNSIDGYVYLPAENSCSQVEHNCVAPNQTPCEITVGVQIRENDMVSSQCGNALGKP